MAKAKVNYDEFMSAVAPEHQGFADNLHNSMLEQGCSAKIELKPSGYFISYTHIQTKKKTVNLLFRKKGMITRIYGENIGHYQTFMDSLPPEMVEAIEKAPVCKRLINPDDCWSKCTMGYDFTIRSEHFQRCKYHCFEFVASLDSNPYVLEFVKNEVLARNAQ
ncbi:MAG: hypothetical protein LBU61_02050 [Coriobacteriales bacterium]|jgi:hypothetical protein|nr:hypothetical protein [Coriobacteriales bacterium]